MNKYLNIFEELRNKYQSHNFSKFEKMNTIKYLKKYDYYTQKIIYLNYILYFKIFNYKMFKDNSEEFNLYPTKYKKEIIYKLNKKYNFNLNEEKVINLSKYDFNKFIDKVINYINK